MNRRFASWGALILALALPSSASAAATRVVTTGSATGTVTALSSSSLTIQTAGRRVGIVNALTAAANSVTKRDYPYVYGGGHAQAGIASIGIKGPGYNGHRVGFDCSGSVAAVLADAAVWPAGSGVPNDAGIVATLRQQHLIVPGVGRGPVEVTLYDHPGVHIFMNIDGRFFGTSDGGGGGNPRGGAGWLDDGAPDASRRVYRPYHFAPSVLRSSTNAGHIVSVQLGGLATTPALELGDAVQVSYEETSAGSLLATAITFPGAVTVTGTVEAVAPDASSFTVQTDTGQALTLLASNPQLAQDLVPGDTVEVIYTTSGTATTARVVTVTATPPGGGGGPSSSPGDSSAAPGPGYGGDRSGS